MAPRWLVYLIPVLVALLGGFRSWQKQRRQVRFIRETLTNGSIDQRRVIASLSTLPDRIDNLEPTIRCLLEQTRPPDEIVIAVPNFSTRQQTPYVIPEYLGQFARVRILRCATDWGPATKFIAVVQEELAAGRGDTLIFVVDDDRTYPRDALETYLNYHDQLPDAALCFRGAAILRKPNRYGLRITFGSEIRAPKRIPVITGCGSYFIQPRFFDSSLWDYSAAPPGAFYMDDIWISGWLDRRGVEKYIVPTSAMMRTVRRQLGTMTLHDVPNGRRYNNNETIAFFRDTWTVFSEPSR